MLICLWVRQVVRPYPVDDCVRLLFVCLNQSCDFFTVKCLDQPPEHRCRLSEGAERKPRVLYLSKWCLENNTQTEETIPALPASGRNIAVRI